MAVALAAMARLSSGLQSLPTWSATSTVSKPSASARRASSAIDVGSSARSWRPNRIPYRTITVVPTGAKFQRNWASSSAWRWQPPESRVPSSSSVW